MYCQQSTKKQLAGKIAALVSSCSRRTLQPWVKWKPPINELFDGGFAGIWYWSMAWSLYGLCILCKKYGYLLRVTWYVIGQDSYCFQYLLWIRSHADCWVLKRRLFACSPEHQHTICSINRERLLEMEDSWHPYRVVLKATFLPGPTYNIT